MTFSNVTFLFFFLPLLLGIYILAGRRLRNLVLFAASLLFYAWGEGIYLLVLLVSILANYFFGLVLSKNLDKPAAKWLAFFGLSFNLILLGSFKYANFITENLNSLLTVLCLPTLSLPSVHLPLGVSFFTFKAISYVIDVYQGRVAAQRLMNVGLYLALFPQLMAGPIVRYGDIAEELLGRKVSLSDFACGVQRFLLGLGKKVLLANPLAIAADQVFSLNAAELSASSAWIGALSYTFQIYYDFSGYSDMAIGLGKMFGFTTPENFNYPYFARSFREFWRRWHITLSLWLRDYLFIPLGGSRHGHKRTCVNIVIVFTLCGLWHGANWTFICWGLYHGLLLVLERTPIEKARQRLWVPAQQLTTFLLVVIGWIFFRSENLGAAGQFLSVMFGLSFVPIQIDLWGKIVDSQFFVVMILAVIFSFPLFPLLQKLNNYLVSTPHPMQFLVLTASYAMQLYFFVNMTYLSIISLAAAVYNPFIYFHF